MPGRDFHFRLYVTADRRTVLIEVTDTRGERLPRRPRPDSGGVDEAGRGLLLVTRLADRWGWHPRPDGPGKTVWAKYVLRAAEGLDVHSLHS